jgi:6-pyruvoyltetrahydropterin/6-carboxytetrahydropterin synthase
MVTVCRKADFCAAHRLNNPDASSEANQRVYGKCNNPNYHGHNYTLIVKVTGPVDPEWGYVLDLKVLQDLIEEEVIRPFDHRNLNLDTEAFAELNPTAENIVQVIWKRLRDRLDPSLSLKTVLYETERNFVEYSGE